MERKQQKREYTTKAGEGETTAAAFSAADDRPDRSFTKRLNDLGARAQRLYDLVRSSFLAGGTAGGQGEVRALFRQDGEFFRSAEKTLGKLSVEEGELRLYLALDPLLFDAAKYHHYDCSGNARCAQFPLMIKIATEQDAAAAAELIGEAVRFGRARGQSSVPGAPSAGSAWGIGVPVQALCYVPVYAGQEGGTTFSPSGTAVGATSSAAPVTRAAAGDEAGKTAKEKESAVPVIVKPPRRGTVVNEQGERIGKIRNYVWRDESHREKGVFVEGEENVFVCSGDTRTGYVDGNDNILTLSNKYLGTIRRPGRRLPVLILLIALITVLTVGLSAYFLNRSENFYAPAIFIATEGGESWEEDENLPVFLNDRFGDSKIAPGMRGSYRFTFENRNDDVLRYSLSFSEQNEYGIRLVYRLKRDGAYLPGAETYVPAEELGLGDLTIEALSSSLFELEWYWQDNDAVDTVAGENAALYTLTISLRAEVAGRN